MCDRVTYNLLEGSEKCRGLHYSLGRFSAETFWPVGADVVVRDTWGNPSDWDLTEAQARRLAKQLLDAADEAAAAKMAYMEDIMNEQLGETP